jgi:hypothetical protein
LRAKKSLQKDSKMVDQVDIRVKNQEQWNQDGTTTEC